MNAPFKVEVDQENEFVHRVIISGELRRGSQLSGISWQQTLAQAKAIADKRKIIFDLRDLTYWDTAGMADIVGAVVSINKANKGTTKRAALIKSKIDHLFKLTNLVTFARRKFPELTIDNDDIPVLNGDHEIISFIEG